MGGHARPYFKHGRALPAHNSNFDAYAPTPSNNTRANALNYILQVRRL